MSKITKGLFILPVIIIGLLVVVASVAIVDRKDDYEVSLDNISVPKYTESAIVFDQGNDFSTSLPFLASAIIDIDGDGVEELYLGGSRRTQDGLFKFYDNKLNAIPGSAGIDNDGSASFGSVVLDVNNDGQQDLLVARESGLWLHQNNKGTFTTTKLNATMPDGTVPLSIAIADLNRDGAFDMYVAGYIHMDLVEGQNIFREGYGGSSRLFINNGDNTFTDKTEEAGLTYQHNTFQSAFIDIDLDGFEDLVVAHDTGHVLTWKNNGDMTFKKVNNPNSTDYSYPMGLALTDLGDDGLVDFFFSNVGSTPPDFMIRGELTEKQKNNWKWMLFKNTGDFAFEDIAKKAKVADYEFSWGAVFEDLNLDGLEDLIVSENYIGLPTHIVPSLRLNGRLLLQKPNGEFASAEKEAGVINRTYSISPLTADFNGDGLPDIVNANIEGNSALFLSKRSEGAYSSKANYLKVALSSNIGSIGATVTAKLADGRTLSRPYVSGEGLCSDSSHVIIFGLSDSEVTQLSVNYLDGRTTVQSGNFKNQLVSL